MEIGAGSSLASHDSGIDIEYGRSNQEPDTSLSDDSLSFSESKSEKSEAPERSSKRKRSPPKTNFDLNDNSLVSVYAFFKTFIGASSASTVAIDNKIEQAMDLVKSHLMFAVREEVEVLKEKIIELMEQINSLEYENSVLRQYAPQEALQQLPKKGGSGSQHQS